MPCFGLPKKILQHTIALKFQKNITIDNAAALDTFNLLNSVIAITLYHPINYYPHGNGLCKSTNKNLLTIIRKPLEITS